MSFNGVFRSFTIKVITDTVGLISIMFNYFLVTAFVLLEEEVKVPGFLLILGIYIYGSRGDM